MPPRPTVWPLTPHTAAKHDLLRRYLGAWFPILANRGFNRRLLFIDGFAGPGVYDTGEPGSPIVALTTLVDHQAFASWSATEFVFFFIEEDRRRHESLVAELDAFWSKRGGMPPNVHVQGLHGAFEDVADGVLTGLEKRGQTLAPTLAFVDPFGYSGASMDTICRLTRFPKCEIFFNFMFSWITRGATHPDDGVRERLVELFGSATFEQAEGMTPEARKAFLHDLYDQQLRDSARFEHVLDFEMVDVRGKSYSLFFGTRHMKGLESMKRAMWGVDPTGQFRFSDQTAGITPLFGAEVDVAPLRRAILGEFSKRTATIEQVHDFVMTKTIYGPDHYKRAVLSKLEKEDGVLHVVSSSRKVANGYPDGTVLAFD